jgi:hypothetical protein
MGSGHTGIICYSYSESGSFCQICKESIKNAHGGNLPLTEVLTNGTPESFSEFIDQLKKVLSDMSEQPTLLYVGATGGLRDSIDKGKITNTDIQAFRTALENTFCNTTDTGIDVVKFVILAGVEEATYETEAAQIIWDHQSNTMFPLKDNVSEFAEKRPIGLFSGGGQSMQLGRLNENPLSFNFSTFNEEFEEKQGASPDAWLNEEKWKRFEQTLLIKIHKESQLHEKKFSGNYICTAMNHRAAMYCQFSEKPIRCDEAIQLLKAALPQFRSCSGKLYDDMMESATGGSSSKSYPLARITACHIFRLCSTLEILFSSDCQLFFARNGTSLGKPIECEWTLGAFKDFISSSSNKVEL